jgi:hypothetical protein
MTSLTEALQPRGPGGPQASQTPRAPAHARQPTCIVANKSEEGVERRVGEGQGGEVSSPEREDGDEVGQLQIRRILYGKTLRL